MLTNLYTPLKFLYVNDFSTFVIYSLDPLQLQIKFYIRCYILIDATSKFDDVDFQNGQIVLCDLSLTMHFSIN